MRTLAVSIVLALTFGPAVAQTDAADAAARQALAKGEYARVLEIYKPEQTAGRSLSDLGHYRLAISHQRLGESKQAWEHLSKALATNPQGTFASSAGRLEELRSSILAGCESKGMPKCQPVPAPAAAPVAAEPEGAAVVRESKLPVPAEPPSALPSTSADAVQPDGTAAALGQPLPRLPDAPRAPVVVSAVAAEPIFRWEPVIATLQALALMLLATVAWRQHRRDKRLPAGADGLERLRDNVASVLARLHLAEGGRDTVLYRQLTPLLPLLEREAGRTVYRATGKAKGLSAPDKKTADMVRHLTTNPPDALTASSQEVAALFQRKAI